MRSPLSGKVLELSVVPGEFRNDTSAPVMTIADLSTVWVSSQVPETYIRFIQPREQVEIRLVAYPDETFEGRVPADRRHGRSADAHRQGPRRDGQPARAASGPRCSAASTTSSRRCRMPVVPAAARSSRTTAARRCSSSRRPATFQERTVVPSASRPAIASASSAALEPGETVVVDGAMLLSGLMKKPA